MKNLAMTIGIYIIGSAIIWGAVILGCSFKLKGTGCYDEISLILAGASSIHLIFIWGPLSAQLLKLNKKLNAGEHS